MIISWSAFGDPMRIIAFAWGVDSVIRSNPCLVLDLQAVAPSRLDHVPRLVRLVHRARRERVGHHARDHGPIRIAAEEREQHLGPLPQREVPPLDPAPVRLHHPHARRRLAGAEVALVEGEAHQVAPVLVELRVVAVGLAVDDPVLGPVDARPRRAQLGPELDRRRDRGHVDAVDLVAREPGEPLELGRRGRLVAVVLHLGHEVLRVEARPRVVLEREGVPRAEVERRAAPGEHLLAARASPRRGAGRAAGPRRA